MLTRSEAKWFLGPAIAFALLVGVALVVLGGRVRAAEGEGIVQRVTGSTPFSALLHLDDGRVLFAAGPATDVKPGVHVKKLRGSFGYEIAGSPRDAAWPLIGKVVGGSMLAFFLMGFALVLIRPQILQGPRSSVPPES